MASVPIGGVRVDLQLNSAAFIRDIAKSTNAMVGGIQKQTSALTGLQKTVNTVSTAFLGFLSVRALKQVVNYTEQCVKLAATIKGPLGDAAKDFQDKATVLNNSFKIGIATSFISTLNNGLKSSGIGMKELSAVGVIAGNLLGLVFIAVVNLFTYAIPEGIKISINAINTLSKAFNDAADARDRLARQPSALAPGAPGSALLGEGTEGGRIPIIDPSGIKSSIKDWVDITAVTNAHTEALKTTEEAQRLVNAQAKVFSDLASASEQAFTDAQTPMEKYASTVEHLNFLLKEGGISAETFGRLNVMAAANATQPWLQVADTIGGALGTMFKDNKAVAIAQAVINTAQAITKSIAEYGFTPIGIAAAAAAAAVGAAQIATILSAQPGSAGGHSKALKGAKGGGATAKAGAASTASSAGTAPGQAINITLKGESGFSREQVRALIGEINAAVGDGAELRVT